MSESCKFNLCVSFRSRIRICSRTIPQQIVQKWRLIRECEFVILGWRTASRQQLTRNPAERRGLGQLLWFRRHSHSFRGSFSAGSTPIFASKHAFCSIFRALQENHLLASKFAKWLQKFSEVCKLFEKSLENFWNFVKFANSCEILQNF